MTARPSIRLLNRGLQTCTTRMTSMKRSISTETQWTYCSSPQRDSLAHTNNLTGLQMITKFHVKSQPMYWRAECLFGIITQVEISSVGSYGWMNTSIFIIGTLDIWWWRLWIMWVKPSWTRRNVKTKTRDSLPSVTWKHIMWSDLFEFLQRLHV